MAVCVSWIACGIGGCEELKTQTIADDFFVTPDDAGAPVDGGSLEDVVVDALDVCRQLLIDAERMDGPRPFNYCSIAWFYQGCPLRQCVEQLARKVEPRCPPRDAGVETPESKLCETAVWPFLPAQP